MARKDHHFFSLRGKKKESKVKKGLGEALGAIGLRPEDDGKCALRTRTHGKAYESPVPIYACVSSKKVYGLTTLVFAVNS